MGRLLTCFLLLLLGAGMMAQSYAPTSYQQPESSPPPLRVAIAGLVHGHVHGLLKKPPTSLEIVGIAEPDSVLANAYAERYGFDTALIYDSLEEMLEATQPEAVLAFTSTFDHLKVVQDCAPRGIHVMVEKPLAVNYRHAQIMDSLVRQHGTWLLTNYETTWYVTHHQLFQQAIEHQVLGPVRKMVFHHGHQGPVEIGCGPAFTQWLCDPQLNGAGALMDFGCYGVNLSTWFTNGDEPEEVLAVTQQIKPEVYAEVDDEATIILIWRNKQAIIQASWNWPYGRKDMAVYGKEGSATANNKDLKYKGVSPKDPAAPKPYFRDPYSYLVSVIRGKYVPAPFDPSTLENNLLTMKILSAALQSARQGKTVSLSE